ncbi:hypothetical protein [Cryptosporangium phraense]|uniref:Uncharacterized protein n=1 Tax=Cryptosporangium phraense TaxID=2593070 RepID=A0A545AV12_9ACTN|nr:hypothetical protein [Cryptosporangium phraense]TQS45154.1 hypothetical protein FL583_11720 [Cryptosporangium phraense]
MTRRCAWSGFRSGFDLHDINLSVLRLFIQRLERTAEGISGLPGSHLRFDELTPVSPQMHRYWRAVVKTANGALMERPSPLGSALLAREMAHHVAVTALHTFPNTTII